MARNSVKAMALPNVETTLVIRPPTYSVVSKCTKLTSPAALAVIPPLNACMDERKTLYGMKIDESKDQLAVVSWPGYEHSPGNEFKILLEFTMRGKLNLKLKRRKSGFLSFAQTSQESNTRLFWKIYRTSSQSFGQVGTRTGFITLLLKWRRCAKLSVIDGLMMTSLTAFSKC